MRRRANRRRRDDSVGQLLIRVNLIPLTRRDVIVRAPLAKERPLVKTVEILPLPPLHLLSRIRRVGTRPPPQTRRQRRERRADDVPNRHPRRGQRPAPHTGSAHDGSLQAHERAEPAGGGDRGEPDGQSEDDGDDGSRPRRAGVSGGGVSRLARAERRLLELGVRQVLGPALFHRLEPPFPVRHGLRGGRREGPRQVRRRHDCQEAQVELEESRRQGSHHGRDDGGHERALGEAGERLQRRSVDRRPQVSKVQRGEIEEHDVLDARPNRPHDSHDRDERPERARDPRHGAVPQARGPPQPLGARSFPVERVAVRGGLVHLVVVVVVGDVGALLPFARSTRALVLVYPEVVQLVAPGVSDRPIYANRRVLGDGTVVGVDPRAVPLRRRAQPKRTRVVPRTPSAHSREPARRNRGDGPRDGKRRARPGARPTPSREPPDRYDYRTGRGRVPHRREQTPRGYARLQCGHHPCPNSHSCLAPVFFAPGEPASQMRGSRVEVSGASDRERTNHVPEPSNLFRYLAGLAPDPSRLRWGRSHPTSSGF